MQKDFVQKIINKKFYKVTTFNVSVEVKVKKWVRGFQVKWDFHDSQL